MPSGGEKTTQTKSSTPWSAAQPYLKEAMTAAQSNFKSGAGAGVWTGDRVAPMSGTTQASIGAMNTAGGQMTAGAQSALGSAQGILNSNGLGAAQQTALGGLADTRGKYTSEYDNFSNPLGSAAFNQGQDFAQGKAEEALKRSLSGMGGLGGNAFTAQSFAQEIGGMRAQALTAEQARQDQLRMGILGNLTGLDSNVANIGQQGQSNRLAALGQIPGLLNGMGNGALLQNQAGQQIDQYGQNILEGKISQFDEQNGAKTKLLNDYLAAITGASSGFSTSTTKVPQGSKATGILGGALTGGAALSGLGPVGAGVGALGGGILGFLN